LTLNEEGGPQNEPEGQDKEVMRSSDSTAAHGYIEKKEIEKVQEATSVASVADLPWVIQSTSGRTNEYSNEGQILTLKNRASNFDPRIESPEEAPRKVKDIPADKLKDEFARDRVTSRRYSSDLEEGQNLTLKNSPSETAHGNSGAKEESEASLEKTSAPDLWLQDNFDKALFFPSITKFVINCCPH
jgi:hypothetical protein